MNNDEADHHSWKRLAIENCLIAGLCACVIAAHRQNNGETPAI
jgi:hypothetical protein